jgi:hypothetical protein
LRVNSDVTYRGIIQVKVSFLDAFTMVALRVGQTEEPLLEKRAEI